MKKTLVALCLLLALAMPQFASTNNDSIQDDGDETASSTSPVPAHDFLLGFSFGGRGYSRTSDVIGGTYFDFTLSAYFKKILFNLSYDTNILTDPFHDHLFSAYLLYELSFKDQLSLIIGPTYLNNRFDFASSSYVGGYCSPLNYSDGSEGLGRLSVSFISLAAQYGLTSRSMLYSLDFIDIFLYF